MGKFDHDRDPHPERLGIPIRPNEVNALIARLYKDDFDRPQEILRRLVKRIAALEAEKGRPSNLASDVSRLLAAARREGARAMWHYLKRRERANQLMGHPVELEKHVDAALGEVDGAPKQ